MLTITDILNRTVTEGDFIAITSSSYYASYASMKIVKIVGNTPKRVKVKELVKGKLLDSVNILLRHGDFLIVNPADISAHLLQA